MSRFSSTLKDNCFTCAIQYSVGKQNYGDQEPAMTLAELLPAVRQLPASDKLRLIRILAEDLDNSAAIFPLEPYKTYDLPTPYNAFGAGEVLMQALKMADSDGN